MAALLNWDRGSSASLFDRIQGKGASSSSDGRLRELLNSIQKHLNEVLNSLQVLAKVRSISGLSTSMMRPPPHLIFEKVLRKPLRIVSRTTNPEFLPLQFNPC